MQTINYVATSSRLLRSREFATRAEAERQAAEWNDLAPVRAPNDCEATSTVYTWAEWCAAAEQNEADPMAPLEGGE